jgi:penicillin-binding protein 2
VGFAPCSAPEIVVATLFENGEHGQLAAPIVRDVMKAYFDKKARLAQPEPQIARLPPQQLLRSPILAAPAPAAVNP